MSYIFTSEDEAFMVAERAYIGNHPIGGFHSAASNLARGLFDIENDVFKIALIMGYYWNVGNTTAARHSYYYDIKNMEAENAMYPAGGLELTGKNISFDAENGITTITWDDITFESEENSAYFDEYLWLRTYDVLEEIWIMTTRRSVIAVIYSDTAENKPILQTLVVNSPNIDYFLSNGEKHTIKTPIVKL